jgi:dTDP-4-dehydrorhamnose reductase
MLGRAWMSLLAERRIPARPLVWPEFDLTDRSNVERHVTSEARAVIDCAAYTDVDEAEAHETLATAINGTGVGWLVERCDALGIPLVHYSTDYVFDGRGSTPYPVDHPTAPLNAYGRSKLAGEQHVRRSRGPHLLIRTSWLYAPWGKNFVLTIARLAKEKPELRVVDDQRGRPTSAEHLARVSLALLEHEARGTFHVTDGGECTWFELATEIARIVSPRCTVVPCTSADVARPAKRPAYSVLDIRETEARVGPMPDWRTNVAAVLARMAG